MYFHLFRSLMPILTMASRNHMLPDDFKVKRSCHKCAVNVRIDNISPYNPCIHTAFCPYFQVMVELMKASFQVDSLVLIETADTPAATESAEEQAVDAVKAADAEESTEMVQSVPSSPMSPSDRRSSTGSTAIAVSAAKMRTPAVALPLAHTCLIGVLQRMMLAPPDRAPVRQLLQVSLVEVISVLGRDLASDADAFPEQLLAVLRSLEHYLVFLSRLSKSSKVAHRSFSLDITAQLLSTAWMWGLPNSASLSGHLDVSVEAVESPCHVLLNVLQDRCTDFSPAARTRALSAIHDLLSSLNKDSAVPMMQALFDAAMGAKPARSARSSPSTEPVRLPLIEILRERTVDDRPQVRTKALQALGLALSMSWPKPTADGVESITMLVSEEDLEVFASHCRDTSLSVRKQAMVSLTELLRSRPADALIQDMWVQSVIPMTFDAESGVSNKVAESLHALLFDNLVAWYQEQQSTRKGGARSEAAAAAELERSEHIALVWKLSAKITHMGMFKILKAVLGIMVKQGYLNASPATRGDGKSASLLGVIGALKFACCFHLAGDADSGAATLSVQNIRSCEPDEIARGAWILLEGLVSLEQMSILNAKQESVKFRDFIRQAGSADFVVRCYRQKHAEGAAVVWDEEDLRIFKVLEILGGNLTEVDSVYMKHQLEDNLQQMQCECHIAAAAIAVMLQLSKASLPEPSPTVADPSKLLKESVTRWTAPLLNSVCSILHTYAFRTRAPNAEVDANSTLGQLLHDWLLESTQSTDASLTMDVSAVLGSSHSDGHASLTAHVLEAVQSALFVLGEVSMLGFSMEEDHFLGNGSKKAASTSSAGAKSAEQFRLPVDESIVDLVKILMGHALPVTATSGVPSVTRECPNKVRANAFVTMGKLCMRNKTLAREHVNIFLREVSLSATSGSNNNTTSSHDVSSLGLNSHATAAAAAVRSNALLVLGDMCIRYTNLVDRHVDTMAQCLQDSDSLVRKNALILLTQLLLQDFLKWKGFLLYRFLVLAVDSDCEIAEFSRNILQKTLSLKYPQLLTNHFTEALVILNGCTAHPAYSSIARTGTVADGDSEVSMTISTEENEDDHVILPEVSFTANLSKAQRFGVYAFMAENMDDETKIQVSAKLVQDVLSAAVDSSTLLPQPSAKGSSKRTDKDKYAPFENVLEDALTLLRSPHLKV